MRIITLGGAKARGRHTFVSERHYDVAMTYRWRVWEKQRPSGTISGPYAVTTVRLADGRRTTLALHQLIMGCTGVDHVNGYGLDNTGPNLRKATGAQNNQNTPKRVDGLSRYKGVGRAPWRQQWRWRARIQVDGKRRSLGYFPFTDAGEVAAARAYNVAAREAFGEFARLNPV
jgi:hypothetical protein